MKRVFATVLSVVFLAAPAGAATLEGIWATEPDGKAQIGHVEIKPCGAALCGTIVRAYDKAGNQVTTPNIGRRILRDVKSTGGNEYGGGKVFVPLMRAEFPVNMTVQGNKLRLRACNGIGVCRSQDWTRVR